MKYKQYKDKYKLRVGTRYQVFNEIALQTSGGLKKKDLFKTKHKIVSLKKRRDMKNSKKNPLAQGGFLRKKGDTEFGPLKPKETKETKKTKKKQFRPLSFFEHLICGLP